MLQPPGSSGKKISRSKRQFPSIKAILLCSPGSIPNDRYNALCHVVLFYINYWRLPFWITFDPVVLQGGFKIFYIQRPSLSRLEALYARSICI